MADEQKNPEGRPPKYDIPEHIKNGLDDCLVQITHCRFGNKDYTNEKELLRFIVGHIKEFVSGFLQDEIVSYEIDKPIEISRRFTRGTRRIDLLIIGKAKTYIIELKTPFYPAENRAGIGQILDYGREFLDPKKEMIIITTLFDINTAKTIEYYKLPIRYVYMDNMRFLEYYGQPQT
jgi:hypothetical protein